jgi:hypothetical protein
MTTKKISITVHLSHIEDKTKIKLIAYSPICLFEQVATQLIKKKKWNITSATHISKISKRNKKAKTAYETCSAKVTLVGGDELLIETNVPWTKVVKSQ